MSTRLKRRIQNSVKHLRWSVLRKKMIIFLKSSILDVSHGPGYTFVLLKLLCRDSQSDTREHLIYAKLIIVFTPNLEFSPYSEVIHGSTTFKLTKGKQRLKKHNYPIRCV